MVKRSRVQSQEAPRRSIWRRMVPPFCSFHFQQSSRNFSRPISRRRRCPSRRQAARADGIGFEIGQCLAADFLLDDQLGGNGGVVRARQPEHVLAAHAMPAHQDVDLRMLQHVAHVEQPVMLGGGITRQKRGRAGSSEGR